MVELPPMNRITRQRRKKPLLTHINSSIFKNGLTWFDIDSATDPYNLAWHKHIPLYEQTQEYIRSKNEFADKRALPPVKSQFDKGGIINYVVKDTFRMTDNVSDKISEMKNYENFLKQEWRLLENNELEFKASVESYNKFVVTNKNKREASHRKISYFKSRTQELMKEINKFRIYNKILRSVIVKMKENYRKHRIYYEFCSDVAHEYGSRNPSAVIDKYLAIKGIEEFGFNRLLSTVQKCASIYNKLKKIETEENDIVHSLIMQLSELKVRYDEISRRAIQSQQFFSKVREKCHIQIECINLTIQGISTLYKNIQARKTDTSHIPAKNIYDRLLYINSKINKFEQIGIATRNIQDGTEPQKTKLDSSHSDVVVYLYKNSSVLKNNSEETANIYEDLISLKEGSIHLKDNLYAKENNAQVETDTICMKEDLVHAKERARDFYREKPILPRLDLQYDGGESKKATFSASLESFRSISDVISTSSFKLPQIERNNKKKQSNDQDIRETKKEIYSNEERKIFDRKKRLGEDKMISLLKRSKSTVMRPRQEKKTRSKFHQLPKYQNIDLDINPENDTSYCNEILNFDQFDNIDFGRGDKNLKMSRRNTTE